MVADATEIYNHARQIAAVSDTGLSSSINRMGEPFRKGYFTLAVVGKMSAGKSTFINALLSDHNLLPTGHFQTTCTLTTILHSDQKRLHIIYGDMHEENITESIEAELRRLVAIPEEYKDLPVNNVNRLILYGKAKRKSAHLRW
jgi:septin family protein